MKNENFKSLTQHIPGSVQLVHFRGLGKGRCLHLRDILKWELWVPPLDVHASPRDGWVQWLKGKEDKDGEASLLQNWSFISKNSICMMEEF